MGMLVVYEIVYVLQYMFYVTELSATSWSQQRQLITSSLIICCGELFLAFEQVPTQILTENDMIQDLLSKVWQLNSRLCA